MAKTLDAAGVKRLIQEIKGANKNLNAAIPISTYNTTESMAQNVKNIADYVEKAKAAGIADVNGMAVTCLIDNDYSGVGYLYGEDMICGTTTYDDLSTPYNFVVQPDGLYTYNPFIVKGTTGQITSDMLATGARKPIILTPSTTEVDEETYQKLLSDDVDVIAKFGEGIFLESQAKFNTGDTLSLLFGYSQFDESNDGVIATYTISINTSAPHTLTLAVIGSCEPVSKSTLSPVLQEIDLTGTDADRKAKLDQFAADWKALTGTSDLTGARFVGQITTPKGGYASVLFTYNTGIDTFTGVTNLDDSDYRNHYSVYLDGGGILSITPLFSHLEAITIKTGNTPDDKAANVAAIKAYVDNLKDLGVDVTKGYMIPICFSNTELGYVMYHPSSTGSEYTGIVTGPGGASSNIAIGKSGYAYVTTHIQPVESNSLTTTAKTIVPAINEVNANAVHSDKLVPTLEAITIYTDNTPEHKQANLDNIAAYEANLQALGVDTTKGWNAPVKVNAINGISPGIFASTEESTNTPYTIISGLAGEYPYITRIKKTSGDSTMWEILCDGRNYSRITTTAKSIIPAINEVNALAKGYSTIFTPIELTTETAQNKTAIDARVAAFTAQGISLTNGCCIPVTYKGVYAGNISLINGDWYGLLVKNTNSPADNINIKLSADGTITEGNSAQ